MIWRTQLVFHIILPGTNTCTTSVFQYGVVCVELYGIYDRIPTMYPYVYTRMFGLCLVAPSVWYDLINKLIVHWYDT